jgi:hypothetical protein
MCNKTGKVLASLHLVSLTFVRLLFLVVAHEWHELHESYWQGKGALTRPDWPGLALTEMDGGS